MNDITLKHTNNIVVKMIVGKSEKFSKAEANSFIRQANETEKTSRKVNSFTQKAFILFGIGIFAASLFIPFTWPVILIILAPLGIAWIVSKVFERQAKEAATYFKGHFPDQDPPPPQSQLSKSEIDKILNNSTLGPNIADFYED